VQIPHVAPSTQCDADESISLGGMQMHALPLSTVCAPFEDRGCSCKKEDMGDAYVGGNMRSAVLTVIKI
jgi:hypothetical protein